MPQPSLEEEKRIAELLRKGASDDEILSAAAKFADSRTTTERIVVDAARFVSGYDGQSHHLSRWYRRAAEDGQLWALFEGGNRWKYGGSHGSTRRDRREWDYVSAEEAKRWLFRAAELGHRTACFEAARSTQNDPRAIEWLRHAYDGGDSNVVALTNETSPPLSSSELGAAALLLADLLDAVGDPEAGEWYRAATERDYWIESNEEPSSWEQAVVQYALWLHRTGDREQCEIWSRRLAEHAAEHGPVNRGYLRSEYKTYRNLWQLVSGQEVAHSKAIRHLLVEHQLPTSERTNLALLYSEGYWFSDDDRSVLKEMFDDDPPRLALIPFPNDGPSLTPEARNAELDAVRAWSILDWIRSTALPAVLALAAGTPTVAAELRGLLDDADTTSFDVQEFVEESLSDTDDDQDHPTAPHDHTGEIEELLTRMGLGDKIAASSERNRENVVGPDLRETQWRLLRGQPAWLAMYVATSEAQRSWLREWDETSALFAFALHAARSAPAFGSGSGPAADSAAQKWRWAAFGKQLAQEFADFLSATPDPARPETEASPADPGPSAQESQLDHARRLGRRLRGD